MKQVRHCLLIKHMKITNVRLTVLETDQAMRQFELVTLDMHRERWLHAAESSELKNSDSTTRTKYEFVIHVDTDEGISGHCTAISEGVASITETDVKQLRGLVVGEDPLYREHLYQKLHQGTRWVYRVPGWFGAFDNCLWDIAGKTSTVSFQDYLDTADKNSAQLVMGMVATLA